MTKKIRLHSFKNIARSFSCTRNGLRKAWQRSRKRFLYAGLGFVLAGILLLSLLWRQKYAFSGHGIVQTGDDPKRETSIIGSNTAEFETDAQVNSNKPQALAAGTVTITIPPDDRKSLSPEPTIAPTPEPAAINFEALTGFYKLEAAHYYNDSGYSSNHYAYTDDELYMLARLICGEARGEPLKGKIAVANVVMNRVLARGYPGDTIKAVITAPGQFSGYSASIRPTSACVYAARQVLDKEVWVIPQNVFFFQSNKPAGENWGSHRYCTKIGGHCFYTEHYGGRSRNPNIPPALYERLYKWPQYGCEPGQRVYRIQYMLDKLGYGIKADSFFGKTTKEAVVAFQAEHRLKADGVAGPSTLKALIKAYGESAYCAKFA